jgi:hypothetical protein
MHTGHMRHVSLVILVTMHFRTKQNFGTRLLITIQTDKKNQNFQNVHIVVVKDPDLFGHVNDTLCCIEKVFLHFKIIVSIFVKLFLMLVLHLQHFFIVKFFVITIQTDKKNQNFQNVHIVVVKGRLL